MQKEEFRIAAVSAWMFVYLPTVDFMCLNLGGDPLISGFHQKEYDTCTSDETDLFWRLLPPSRSICFQIASDKYPCLLLPPVSRMFRLSRVVALVMLDVFVNPRVYNTTAQSFDHNRTPILYRFTRLERFTRKCHHKFIANNVKSVYAFFAFNDFAWVPVVKRGWI